MMVLLRMMALGSVLSVPLAILTLQVVVKMEEIMICD